jgi:hypothetical protein
MTSMTRQVFILEVSIDFLVVTRITELEVFFKGCACPLFIESPPLARGESVTNLVTISSKLV